MHSKVADNRANSTKKATTEYQEKRKDNSDSDMFALNDLGIGIGLGIDYRGLGNDHQRSPSRRS